MTSFDRKFARLLLELCRYTYAAGIDDAANQADKKDALAWITQAGPFDDLVMLDDGQAFSTSVACVAAYPDRNVVSYMGTKTDFDGVRNAIDSIEDWQRNFQTLAVPFRLSAEQLGGPVAKQDDLGGLVHAGFLQQLDAVQAKVIDALMKRGGRSRPLYVTGHSQGAAEAALATRAFLAGGFPVAAAYTFAAPRPGNLDFVNTIPPTLPVHRLEFGDDIVPHVPPTLAGREVQDAAWALSQLPFLSDDVRKFARGLRSVTADKSFAGVGRLCYGSGQTKSLRVDISAGDEAKLFMGRVMHLLTHPGNWAEHHHLAGTSDEVRQGLRGNYTALVSDYALAS